MNLYKLSADSNRYQNLVAASKKDWVILASVHPETPIVLN